MSYLSGGLCSNECPSTLTVYYRHQGGCVFIAVSSLVSLFVCMLLAGLWKNYSSIFAKFGGKVAHGPRKKQLYFKGHVWWG